MPVEERTGIKDGFFAFKMEDHPPSMSPYVTLGRFNIQTQRYELPAGNYLLYLVTDGKPVTADDVVWSFETLLAKGAPLYRFYYATAGELDVALGDPHPGNYLLCDDGKVAFFDFGMIRELPRSYLRREGEVLAAIRDGDADADLLCDVRQGERS